MKSDKIKKMFYKKTVYNSFRIFYLILYFILKFTNKQTFLARLGFLS